MSLISRLLLRTNNHSDYKSSSMSNHVFYKIVDFSKEKGEYSIQCINTKAIFKQRICDIVFDVDILHGLHPAQACYIGLESGKRMEEIAKQYGNKSPMKTNFLISRYGSYEVCQYLRNGNISFIDKRTGSEHVMDPRDVCLSEEIISEFDASHAFYIGMYAAIKRDASTWSLAKARKKPNLKVIK